MPDATAGQAAKKPVNPPQQAGQKRKDASNHSDGLKNKRAKADEGKGAKQQGVNQQQNKQGLQAGKGSAKGNPNAQKTGPGKGGKQNGFQSRPQQTGRQKAQKSFQNARVLATQTTSKAFKDGSLDVDKFVKAREFEIRAMQDGLERSKLARNQRAFQQVPREMRRRAGAWNVRRLPKDKRAKATRQIIEDNTPTGKARKKKLTRHMRIRLDTVKRLRALGAKRKAAKDNDEEVVVTLPEMPAAQKTRAVKTKKNALKEPGQVKSKFRKRQMHKTWLPTHIFHAKRMLMSPAMEPVWRFAMPMTPTAKSYRPTHTAATLRGALAWDTSFMGTIGLEGVEASLLGVLKGLHAKMMDGSPHRLWLNGVRIWQGWLYTREDASVAICPATVIWQAEEVHAETEPDHAKPIKAPRRKLMIRAHPSAFHLLWEEVLRLAKVQKPQATVEDLRYEIGAMEVIGAGSTEALQAVLWPSLDNDDQVADEDGKTWKTLAGVQSPASLPPCMALSFKISDPRLHHPPRQVQMPDDPNALLQSIMALDRREKGQPQALFTERIRRASVIAMQSDGAINRRKAKAAPGEYPAPLPTDPSIPTIIFTSPHASLPGSPARRTKNISYTILAPWRAIPRIWHSIMYYPLSTGGQPRIGGLEQQRQLAFEDGTPWWPGDFPGTAAGDAWIARETAQRKTNWERRPPSRRTAFATLDLGTEPKGELGEGWALPFNLLWPDHPNTPTRHLSRPLARAALASSESAPGSIFVAKFVDLGRGTPLPCARVYALPTDPAKRRQWTSLLPESLNPSAVPRPAVKPMNRILPISRTERDMHVDISRLARELLEGAPRDAEWPDVPGQEALIGFVTTGAFNLREGRGAGIASLGVDAVRKAQEGLEGKLKNVVIVRNAGERVGRLALWEMV